MKMSVIVRSATRLLSPFLVVYSLYLMVFGHLTPGGGFQAGVIFAASVILLILSRGYKEIRDAFSSHVIRLLESSSILIILLLAITGLGFGGFFFNFIRGGEFGSLFSGGIVPIFNILVGLEVGAAFVFLFYIFLKEVEND